MKNDHEWPDRGKLIYNNLIDARFLNEFNCFEKQPRFEWYGTMGLYRTFSYYNIHLWQ